MDEEEVSPVAIIYICRHCHFLIGRLEEQGLSEIQLGFNQLTPEEREDIITNDAEGNRIVRITCESCQEVVDSDPERLLYPSLYH